MSKPNLNSLYNEYNSEYFDGELPDVELEWNTLYRTRGGSCHYKWVDRNAGTVRPFKISINERLLANDPEGLRSTLIHEMVHVYRAVKTNRRCGHDFEFQSKMDSILGYRKSHRTHQHDTKDLREKRQIEYVCPVHGVVGHRARMPRVYDMNRYSCAKIINSPRGHKCGQRIKFVDTRAAKSVRSKSGLSIKVRIGGK